MANATTTTTTIIITTTGNTSNNLTQENQKINIATWLSKAQQRQKLRTERHIKISEKRRLRIEYI